MTLPLPLPLPLLLPPLLLKSSLLSDVKDGKFYRLPPEKESTVSVLLHYCTLEETLRNERESVICVYCTKASKCFNFFSVFLFSFRTCPICRVPSAFVTPVSLEHKASLGRAIPFFQCIAARPCACVKIVGSLHFFKFSRVNFGLMTPWKRESSLKATRRR